MRSAIVAACLLVISAAPGAGATLNVPSAEFPTIQAAIDASSNGDTILVAPGTYRELLDFGSHNVSLSSSGGPSITFLDGDLDADGTGDGRVIHMAGGQSDTTVIEGFTIRNGRVDASGGGIYIANASPVIRNNRITSNTSGWTGGTVYLGGGIHATQSAALIHGNLIDGNYVFSGGGGIGVESFSGVIENNRIVGNDAHWGGGINVWSDRDGYPLPVIRNNVILDNSYHWDGRGGGIIFVYASGHCVNNVISGNQSEYGGGIDMNRVESPRVVVRNNIIWGNTAALGSNIYDVSNGEWYHNDIESDDGQGVIGSNGNISADPLFVDAAGGDLRPLAGSPCIDAGEGAADTPALDHDGNARVDDPATEPNTGAGSPDYVDIGAYEYQLPDSPPIAGDDLAVTDEETPVRIPVLENDSDPDGDPLSITAVDTPAHGTAAIDGESILYTPAAGFSGSDSFGYSIGDGMGGSAQATVHVTVNHVNRNPIAVADAASTPEDAGVAVDVLLNDSDPDGDPLWIVTIGTPAHGTTEVAGGSVLYTPAPDYNGTDSFSYTIADGVGGGASAVVTVTIDPVNDSPVARPDATATDEDTPVLVDVLLNDSDVDEDSLTIDSVEAPAHGTAEIVGGVVLYTPALDFNSLEPVSFSYSVSDGRGGTASATVSVTVHSLNDNPVADDDAASTAEDTPVTIDVLDNDYDVDGDLLSIATVASAAHGETEIVGASIVYTPAPDYNGPDSFAYTVSDGQGGGAGAMVTITVDPVNDNPVALADEATTAEDAPIAVDVLSNDSDPDGDPLSIISVGAPANGIAEISGDRIVYTPNPNFHGTDTFGYATGDGHGGSGPASMSITVQSVNDSPVAADDAATTPEETPVAIDVLANDSDVDGDPLSIDSVEVPAHGTAAISGDSLVYTPDAGFEAVESFGYTILDSQGGSASATITVTVSHVNDEPIAADDSASTAEDTPVTVDVLENDADPDGDPLSIASVGPPGHGDAAVVEGGIRYAPGPNYFGPDSFTYTVVDGQGGSATATVSIIVDPVNDNPVANRDAASTGEDTPVTIAVLANDSDLDLGALSIVSISAAVNGTAVIAGDAVLYTPAANFHGGDSFTYTISDGQGGSATALVDITVVAVNDHPVAVDDAATTPEEVPVAVHVLTNDTDVDGDLLSIDSAGSAAHGTAVISGDFVIYTGAPGFSGEDSFLYTVSDGHGGLAAAIVRITISQVNHDPVAVDDGASTSEDSPIAIAVLANDGDVDGDGLSVLAVGSPGHGATTLEGDTVRYTPEQDFHGSDTFSYTVSDGAGGVGTATVTVAVLPVNDAPVAADDAKSTAEDIGIEITVLANDSDVDDDSLSVEAVGSPSHGEATVIGNSILYSPARDFHGTDSFTYSATDGDLSSGTATVTVTIDPINDDPVAEDDEASTTEGEAVRVSVLGNDSDVDGDALSIGSVEAPAHGVSASDGADVVYTPEPGYSGFDSFVYTVVDGNGGFATGTVVVTILTADQLFIRGDTNGEGDIDIADAVYVLWYLFFGGPAPPCLEASEVNGDGRLDLADPIYILVYQFQGGDPPPAPFPACGTSDGPSLGCEGYAPCE